MKGGGSRKQNRPSKFLLCLYSAQAVRKGFARAGARIGFFQKGAGLALDFGLFKAILDRVGQVFFAVINRLKGSFSVVLKHGRELGQGAMKRPKRTTLSLGFAAESTDLLLEAADQCCAITGALLELGAKRKTLI